MKEKTLTNSTFWDGCYKGRPLDLFDPQNWRDYVSVQLSRILTSIDLDQKQVLEIGGGDAKLLAWLVRQNSSSKFTVLDFSPAGCELARKRALHEHVTIDVVNADMFMPPPEMLGRFDVVLSHGLVEHFPDLADALAAKMRFLSPSGVMFTLIPNLASPIYAYLTHRWSKRVWDLHMPHSMSSFLKGHVVAGLDVVKHGYLGSVEFGMLSMAAQDVPADKRAVHFSYLWLTRLSKLIHFLEFHITDLPATRFLSPFMWSIARRGE